LFWSVEATIVVNYRTNTLIYPTFTTRSVLLESPEVKYLTQGHNGHSLCIYPCEVSTCKLCFFLDQCWYDANIL